MNKFIKKYLTKIFSIYVPLLGGDTLMLDRWLWLKRRLPITKNQELLLDIGCGCGLFTTGASKRGYNSLGLTWDLNEKNNAEEIARNSSSLAKFEVMDVRNLDIKQDWENYFDIAICFENIEHILNDQKLIKDIFFCLKPGGRLLLTTPNYYFKSITNEDGPCSPIEDGGHVRRGYTKERLKEMLDSAGLKFEEISFCSGFLSQKITKYWRITTKLNPLLAKIIIFPFRIIPIFFDEFITKIINYPFYCICIAASKPIGDK